MDPLSDVISFLQLRRYRVGGFEAGGNWSIGFGAYEAIKCYAVTSGACWIVVEGAGEPVFLHQGDCFLLPHGRPFQIASDLALPPDDWQRYFVAVDEGTLVKLNDSPGVTVLGGHFQLAGPQAEILLGMLPPVVHLQGETDRATLRWAFDRMRQELTDLKPGGILVVEGFHRDVMNYGAMTLDGKPLGYQTNALLRHFLSLRIELYEDRIGFGDWQNRDVPIVRMLARKQD